MQDFKKMYIWKEARKLNKKICTILYKFPEKEKFALIPQMRRASASIALNIAEGRGRNTDKDFRHFLIYAISSLKEVEAQTLIAEDLRYIEPQTSKEIRREINRLGFFIMNLIKKLK